MQGARLENYIGNERQLDEISELIGLAGTVYTLLDRPCNRELQITHVWPTTKQGNQQTDVFTLNPEGIWLKKFYELDTSFLFKPTKVILLRNARKSKGEKIKVESFGVHLLDEEINEVVLPSSSKRNSAYRISIERDQNTLLWLHSHPIRTPARQAYASIRSGDF